jgi:Cu2+-exporting ATPase
VVGLERHAAHPVAEGFRAAWPGLEPARAEDVRVTVGGGVEGTVAGRRIAVGSPDFVRAHTGVATGLSADWPARLTPVLVARDGEVIARAGFADPIRSEAPDVLADMRRRRWRPRLLSGDHAAVVAEVGRALDFAAADSRAAASPEEKLAVIADATQREPAVMVGDGVNDAAAIARASVGVGVRGGAEACLAAADVFLARPGLVPLVELLDGSRRTLAIIRRGIAFSLVYNLAGATLAMTGVVNPLIAAILMPASSITVVLGAWWGRTFDGRPS